MGLRDVENIKKSCPNVVPKNKEDVRTLEPVLSVGAMIRDARDLA